MGPRPISAICAIPVADQVNSSRLERHALTVVKAGRIVRLFRVFRMCSDTRRESPFPWLSSKAHPVRRAIGLTTRVAGAAEGAADDGEDAVRLRAAEFWTGVANKQLELMGRSMTELWLTQAAQTRFEVQPFLREQLRITRIIISAPDPAEIAAKRKAEEEELERRSLRRLDTRPEEPAGLARRFGFKGRAARLGRPSTDSDAGRGAAGCDLFPARLGASHFALDEVSPAAVPAPATTHDIGRCACLGGGEVMSGAAPAKGRFAGVRRRGPGPGR